MDSKLSELEGEKLGVKSIAELLDEELASPPQWMNPHAAMIKSKDRILRFIIIFLSPPWRRFE
jgi:hypothetical protein